MMPKRYEDQIVSRRLRNGACVMKRRCKQCGREFTGERNTCRQCCNMQRKEKYHFDAEYHRQYYHRRLSKAAMLRRAGDLSAESGIRGHRTAAWEKQRQRIIAEMQKIKAAGLSPYADSIFVIERAGIQLD